MCVCISEPLNGGVHIFPLSLLFINPKLCLESGVHRLLCICNIYKLGPWSAVELIAYKIVISA